MHSAMAELPLIRRSLIEHEALIAEAGVPELLRRTGWIKLFRSDATLGKRARAISNAPGNMASTGEVLDRDGDRGARAQSDRRFRRRGPFPDARVSCPIPAGWPRPMRRCSSARADAFWSATRERSSRTPADGASPAPMARSVAREIVVALGPWSDLVFRSARIFDPARRQARLSSASGAARQCRAQSSRARFRSRLICWRR